MNATPLSADGLRAIADHLRYFVPSAGKIADDLSKYALLLEIQKRELDALRKDNAVLNPGHFGVFTCLQGHMWTESAAQTPFSTCPHCEISDLRAKLAAVENTEEQATPELKPCPCCGERAELTREFSTSVPQHDIWYVTCSRTYCRAATVSYTSRDDAINAWNRNKGKV